MFVFFNFADPESAHEDDNQPLPSESRGLRLVTGGALYAVHSHRSSPEGFRFRGDDVQAAALPAR